MAQPTSFEHADSFGNRPCVSAHRCTLHKRVQRTCVKQRTYRAPPSVYTQPSKQRKKAGKVWRGSTSTAATESGKSTSSAIETSVSFCVFSPPHRGRHWRDSRSDGARRSGVSPVPFTTPSLGRSTLVSALAGAASLSPPVAACRENPI